MLMYTLDVHTGSPRLVLKNINTNIEVIEVRRGKTNHVHYKTSKDEHV